MVKTVSEWFIKNSKNYKVDWDCTGKKVVIKRGKECVTIEKNGLQNDVKWNGELMATTNNQLDAIEILDMAFKKENGGFENE